MAFHADGISHTGRVRNTNADRFLVGRIERSFNVLAVSGEIGAPGQIPSGTGGQVLVVADGIGASEFGHEASSLAVETILEYFTRPLALGSAGVNLEDDLVDQLARTIINSHEKVAKEVSEKPDRKGMATTLTMAFVLGNRAWITHVGDSRAYLVHRGEAVQLTKDQTIAQMLVDSGVLDADTAGSSRLKHILASAIGGSATQLPDVLSYTVNLAAGDSLVLCTDGLNKHVTEEQIAKVVSGSISASDACMELIELTLADGGSDNVTVIVGTMADD